MTPTVPEELTTGCFVLRDEVVGVAGCAGRVTHAGLNKDNGLVDPGTGTATNPTTPRGLIKDNFGKAVTGAVNETRRQWEDLRSELTSRYGQRRAAVMICALTRDDPVNECTGRMEVAGGLRGFPGVAVTVVLLLVGVALATTVLTFRRGRRRP